MRTLLAATALALAGALALTGAATAAPAAPPRDLPPLASGVDQRSAEPGRVGAASAGSGTASTAAVGSGWLTRLNLYRSQFGVPPVSANAALAADLQLHTDWMAYNDIISHSEVPGSPLYTVAGHEAAGRSVLAVAYAATPEEFVDIWASAPFHMIGMLRPWLSQSGFAWTKDPVINGFNWAGMDVGAVLTNPYPTTGWPRVWPTGETLLDAYSGYESPDPIAARLNGRFSCPQGQESYGLPIIVDFGKDAAPGDPAGAVTSAKAVLRANGAPVSICAAIADSYSDPDARDSLHGKVLVIPHAPLRPGTVYTGTVTTNQGTATINFNTASQASGVAGDHNGDRRADVLAISATGQLIYYQSTGTALRAGYVTGQNWNRFTWFSQVDDLNADGRSELVARRDDGTLWIYRGLGMGRFGAGVQVGSGWNNFRQLVVTPDADGDGRPELVGIHVTSANLYRYSFTGLASYLRGPALIGQRWGAITKLISVGDFSGDRIPDVLGVVSSGDLILYQMNSAGSIVRQRKVGQNWQNMDTAFSPGDLDLNGTRDLVARRADGNLYSYPNRGTSWGAARLIGSNWGAIRLLA